MASIEPYGQVVVKALIGKGYGEWKGFKIDDTVYDYSKRPK